MYGDDRPDMPSTVGEAIQTKVKDIERSRADRSESNAGTIEKRFMLLQDRLSELDDCIARLINRIDPILSQDARGESPGPDSAPSADGVVVRELDNRIDQVQRLIEVVADVNTRVQL